MRRPQRNRFAFLLAGLALLAVSAAAQMPFREYPGWEYEGYPLPSDYQEPGEWVFARLMYPPSSYGYRYGWRRNWTEGGTSWTIDYPRADRRIAATVRRLTRIQARSVEQPVNLDDGNDVFNWPWIYAVEVGSWELNPQQAQTLREYLLRGGFLMVDDFHGALEWEIFTNTMDRVFPDRAIVDLKEGDPIFHTLWDLDEKFQVPGLQYVQTGRTYEVHYRFESDIQPHWRGIYDDNGRIMVAICHNMDLGDAIEHADTPRYPQNYSAQGMRTFLNYLMYSMTH
jgi:hypothetical protein